MNFFEYQARARLRTRWLAALYLLAVAWIAVAVYGAVVFAWWCVLDSDKASAASFRFWNPALFEMVVSGTVAVILGGTIFKMLQLASGGVAVARLLGATLIRGDTTDAAEKRMLNVAAEMAIAAGLPVPQVFVLRDERAINALMAGLSPTDAALVVSRGALDRLSRDELQAIMAHEISHVLNGDMRLNLHLVGVLHGIQILALIGHGMLCPVLLCANLEDDDECQNGIGGIFVRGGLWAVVWLILGASLLLIGYLGAALANVIKAAVSREREFLADAEAVQFTRNPQGLVGALKKIGARAMGGYLRVPEAAQISHMFIVSPAPDWWFSPFNTHPPLLARIRRFDPEFDGNFARVREALQRADPAWVAVVPKVYARSDASARQPHPGTSRRWDAPCLPNPIYAAALLREIPEPCHRMIESADGAQVVLFALLLARRPEIRRQQLARLAARAPGVVYARLPFVAGLCEAMPEAARLPLADLAVGALRSLDHDRYPGFRNNLIALVTADDALDIFELALLHMVSRRLDRQFGIIGPPRIRYGALEQVRGSIGFVLSALAWNGTDDPATAAAAYEQGWRGLDMPPPPMRVRQECSLPQMEEHLGCLAELQPRCKAQLLAACGRCVSADGHTTLREAETLRAIADALDCPVPPFAPE